MEKTVKENLNELALICAQKFVEAFLEAISADFTFNNGYELEDLHEKNNFDGIYLKCVDTKGGHEGGVEHVERTYEVCGLDLGSYFFQQCGYYESYNGIEWDDTISRVWPRQVIVTQYFGQPE